MNTDRFSGQHRPPLRRRPLRGDHAHDDLAAYALGALPTDENAAFASHLEGCDSCQVDLPGYAATSALLGASLAQQPPALLRAAVMEQIARTRQLPPVVAMLPRGPGAVGTPARRHLAAAAASLAIVGVGLGVTQVAGPAPTSAQQVAATAPLAFVQAPAGSPTVLLTLRHLPTPESGVLVLWAIGPLGTRSLGPLVTQNGSATVPLSGPATAATTWAVTVERDADVTSPTSSPLVAASRPA